MAHGFYAHGIRRFLERSDELTEVVSVKRRTWRTAWLVPRTFRERRLIPWVRVSLSTTPIYDPAPEIEPESRSIDPGGAN